MKTFFRTSDEVQLHYTFLGEGETLVFVHGWSGSGEDFLSIARGLSKSYGCLLYDQRGHGYSDHPSWGLSLERLARDLRELLEALHIKNCLLLGWSMGVSVVLEYLRLYGEEGIMGLVLMDSSPKLLPSQDWNAGLYGGNYSLEEALEDLEDIRNHYEAFSHQFMGRMLPHLSKESLDFLQKQKALKGIPAPSLLALEALWKELIYRDDREIFPRLHLPVKIFRGKEPSLYGEEAAQWMKDHLAQGEVVSFEKATHLLVLERPRQIQKEIEGFMMELGKSPKRKGD